MDIVVTTPKREIANAAREAEDCIRAGGGFYFRRLGWSPPASLQKGNRVFYVEDGYLRGFALADRIVTKLFLPCDTTGKLWPAGWYVVMRAETWKWIEPIPMRGFMGWRYLQSCGVDPRKITVVGDWLDQKPEVNTLHRS